MPDRPAGAGPENRSIIRDSGELPPAHTADDAAGDAAERMPVDDEHGGYQDEAYIEHEHPTGPVPIGYTESGQTVYAEEVGYTESGDPVFSEQMYTANGDPVAVDEVILAPVTVRGGEPGSADDAIVHGGYGEAPGRRRRDGGARGRVRRKHHPVLVGLAIALVAIVLVAVLLAWWAKDQIDPGGKPGPLVTVVIPQHSSTKAIGSILAKAGVIHSSTLFPYYVNINSGGTLYPGTYQLAKNESYGKVINALEAGPKVIEDRLTIPEGYTLQQIAQAVAKLPDVHISAAQFLAAAHSGQVTSPYAPPGTANLEGLLFPATYMVRAGQNADDILQGMVGAFDVNAQQVGLTQGAAKLGMTPYQVITVASMVEKEAKRDQDRGPIASVIYNRLRIKMPLGVDSTLLYGLEQSNPGLNPATVNPHTPSPYNTRDNAGLPPTPIANAGLPSLDAAVNPPVTPYLYYALTGPGGQTSFAATNQQFQQLQAQCKAAGYCS